MNKRPNWINYYLNIAGAVSRRSTCLRRKYGAIIVKNSRIISTGYNGSPRGDKNCCDLGVCERERLNIPSGERYELCKSVHAEMNAIINGNPYEMDGAVLYLTGYEADGSISGGMPCFMCERAIINAGIDTVYSTVTPGGGFQVKVYRTIKLS